MFATGTTCCLTAESCGAINASNSRRCLLCGSMLMARPAFKLVPLLAQDDEDDRVCYPMPKEAQR